MVPGPVRRRHPRRVPPATYADTAGEDIPELPLRSSASSATPATTGGPACTSWPSRRRLCHHQGRAQRQDGQAGQVTRRDKRQVHILTSRQAGVLAAADVIYRMGSRWREENYFRYGRAHFALDALDSYASPPRTRTARSPAPPGRKPPPPSSPRRKTSPPPGSPRRELTASQSRPRPGRRRHHRPDARKLDVPVASARRKLQDAQAAAKATPAKIALSEHNPGMVRLDTETKLITHAIRMAASTPRPSSPVPWTAATHAPATRRTPDPRSPHHQLRHHPGRQDPACPPGPPHRARRTAPGPPMRPAQRHQDDFPRHRAHLRYAVKGHQALHELLRHSGALG